MRGKGIHFKIADRSIFDEGLFAGICVAHGCAPPVARVLAKSVATTGEHKTTVVQRINMAHLRSGCGMIGVLAIEIAPRRT